MRPAPIGAALVAAAAAATSAWALATTPAGVPQAQGAASIPAPTRQAAPTPLLDERFADPGLPHWDVVHAARAGSVRVLASGDRRLVRFTVGARDHLWDDTNGAALALVERPAEGSVRAYTVVFRTGRVPLTRRWQALAKWSSSRRDAVPAVALMLDGGRIVLQLGTGPDGRPHVVPGPRVADGAWHTVLLRVTWASGPAGRAALSVDGRAPVTFAGATHAPGPPPDTLQVGYTRDARIGGTAHVDIAQVVIAQ